LIEIDAQTRAEKRASLEAAWATLGVAPEHVTGFEPDGGEHDRLVAERVQAILTRESPAGTL